MEFIGPRADCNCPSEARAITISPRADKFQIARPLMRFLVNRIPNSQNFGFTFILYNILLLYDEIEDYRSQVRDKDE